MSLTNFVDQVVGVFIPQVKVYTFYIYTNEAITATPTTTNNDQYIAIAFNSLYDMAYKNQVEIAYEPLENGQFAQDSLHDTPFTLKLTGLVCPLATSAQYTNQDYRNELAKTGTQLDTYLHNLTLLTVLGNYPLFRQYSNLKLTNYDYDITPDHNNLVAHLEFQEIRIVTSTQYGSLQQNQVANPANTSQVDNGTQTAIVPANDNSVIMAGG